MPEFLRLNPYGKVPVLVDEDEVVYDSTIINEYLEDEYPLPRLLPEDSQGRARARLASESWSAKARALEQWTLDEVGVACG